MFSFLYCCVFVFVLPSGVIKNDNNNNNNTHITAPINNNGINTFDQTLCHRKNQSRHYMINTLQYTSFMQTGKLSVFIYQMLYINTIKLTVCYNTAAVC